MSTVDDLILNVIRREGGFVNNASDRGGATKYGITIGTLARWRHQPQSVQDVADLTMSEAVDIYKNMYIVGPGFDHVADSKVQEFLFDYGVNSGPGAATQALQRAIGVKDDGSFGPISQAALAKVVNWPALFYRLKCERYEALLRYIGHDSSQAIFAAGWANRLDEFEEKLT